MKFDIFNRHQKILYFNIFYKSFKKSIYFVINMEFLTIFFIYIITFLTLNFNSILLTYLNNDSKKTS